MTPNHKSTVEEARDYVITHRDGGVSCPVCERLVHVRQRTIHRAMAEFLAALLPHYDQHPGRFVHSREVIPDAEKASTDASYLVHWGLVERRGRGMYRATASGVAWVREPGRTVPRYAAISNNRVLGWSGTMIYQDALGTEPPQQATLFPAEQE